MKIIKTIKPEILPITGSVFACLYWFVDSAIDTFIFHSKRLYLEDLLRPDTPELLARSQVVVLMMILSFVAMHLLRKQQVIAEQYKDLAAHLEQRVAEQVKTIEGVQRQLYQSEKMSSVGQLAAGIAHEINNPIGFINSNLSTAKDYVESISAFGKQIRESADSEELESAWKEYDLDFVLDDFKSLLQESIDGAERVTAIVKDMKDFSNVDRVDEEVADINRVIKSACNVAHNQLGTDIELEFDMEDIPLTKCQPGHLGQVLLSLLQNAAQSIKGKGKITIQTSSKDRRILVRITDTGVGMPEEVMARIFEPFFTTRDVGQGIGLGLTVSRDIVLAHGGEIEVESDQGKGTTVSFWLPVIISAKGVRAL